MSYVIQIMRWLDGLDLELRPLLCMLGVLVVWQIYGLCCDLYRMGKSSAHY